ncbi:AGAP001147-PA-like protein [Anopheles sinensis]|uniref:AGAP001147-PA-like protein n=1 Tax=Anopheles sinensis TaxID=74873 RepID=A0A084W0J6_ANOSI|nr:AGAP001147-PA-like protein [Anopheles sinensis]
MSSPKSNNSKTSIRDEDLSTESVEVLRERLNTMKRLIAERQNSTSGSGSELWNPHSRSTSCSGIIDGNFLSVAFGGALIVILSVSVYAFYNLYHAVLKKFPSQHTEL